MSIDTITREFTARFNGGKVTLKPITFTTPSGSGQETVWEVWREGTTTRSIGILVKRVVYDGWCFAHPEEIDEVRVTVALGVNVKKLRPAKLNQFFYGIKSAVTAKVVGGNGELALVTDVTETTPPCEEWAYKKLLSAIEVFVRPKYAGGMLPEGEAWRQAVILPRMMEGTRIGRQDLRRALRECGWYLGDSVRRYWYYTG